MQSLILFVSEEEKFDKTKIKEIFDNIPGVENLREEPSDDASLECDFKYKDRSTIVILHNDLEIISISGIGDESLKIAIEIQDYYPKPLRIIDSGYSFDLVLEGISSVTELRQRMLQAS